MSEHPKCSLGARSSETCLFCGWLSSSELAITIGPVVFRYESHSLEIKSSNVFVARLSKKSANLPVCQLRRTVSLGFCDGGLLMRSWSVAAA